MFWLAQLPPLQVVYPADQQKTQADRIFLIGTADPRQTVTINGQLIQRSPAGHFAPSFPLQLGPNQFELRSGDQRLTLTVIRQAAQPALAPGTLLADLQPQQTIAVSPGQPVCFSAIAVPQAQIQVQIGSLQLPLQGQAIAPLPSNSAVLIGQNQPDRPAPIQRYEGCTTALAAGFQGQPQFQIQAGDRRLTQAAPGSVTVWPAQPYRVATVTAPEAIARTGPSTDHSRLTPLPQGTQAQVLGQTGEWLQLAYGGWMRTSEARLTTSAALPRSQVRSASFQSRDRWLEFRVPLNRPAPLRLEQQGDRLTLQLYETTAQTDTIRLSTDPWLRSFRWEQARPGEVTYHLQLASQQQWGYRLRYDGNILVLSIRKPPTISQSRLQQPLRGLRIYLDPGHGSAEDLGARGPDGTPEKDVTLTVSNLLRDRLQQLGAAVLMSRKGDEDIWPQERAAQIQALEPDIALSLHYNALPDAGDAEGTQGIGAFWYQDQSQDLARSLHDSLVSRLQRPSYGIFWNNLALTRPTVAPSVLLELGFMINPREFEWIVDLDAQSQLVEAIAQGLVDWFHSQP
ncbi:N-acetylmuramoyl-L-alanine amidase [Synechococcus elongatus]|uniref:Cell wall hydrolase/autolysin n=2 Tax=Synechococcus elongatus TaxID=32046 RepID=Q31QC3_SYNE7|nr:N-acetylmuramoyl-L-alanine amidase [Synechococcus elongatus]ABB56746.1 Cell wall hydrolase/autolysin [Synechococcus elongatus PCC 7942 = FACHB-805]AJD58713.1 N-acetylmuramoyl-L-alanine amidase [Synechococcus elongatus UTEX 2973]MBD2588606.1 N-acetylmuramoyl-L-alanine amidase [Synechococcus elongatus FACHB-242]MBD2689805.1 N-acetylmuramoyl-L-alanine amidase [Synechococcus elongatus FACHB-1061]MBD2708412.1 N-acetylmuramoyl-L-alanine amidase [Synechococcus elongatus PCC 7942 = FACHB-805]